MFAFFHVSSLLEMFSSLVFSVGDVLETPWRSLLHLSSLVVRSLVDYAPAAVFISEGFQHMFHCPICVLMFHWLYELYNLLLCNHLWGRLFCLLFSCGFLEFYEELWPKNVGFYVFGRKLTHSSPR